MWLNDLNWRIRYVNPQFRKTMDECLSHFDLVVWLELVKWFLSVSLEVQNIRFGHLKVLKEKGKKFFIEVSDVESEILNVRSVGFWVEVWMASLDDM